MDEIIALISIDHIEDQWQKILILSNDLIVDYPKLNLFLDNFEKTYKGTLIMNKAGAYSSDSDELNDSNSSSSLS